MKFQTATVASVLAANVQVQAMTHTLDATQAVASVVGDATFPVDGPVSEVCSGKASDPNHPNRCPDANAQAIANCVENIPSYVSPGNCVLPRDAWCVQLDGSDAVGCVLSPEQSTTTTTPTPSTSTTPTPASDTRQVVGDATYHVDLEDGQGLCGVNGGNRCPNNGAEATEGCTDKSFSYDPATQKCTLNQDAWCWGNRCVIHEIPNQKEVRSDDGNTLYGVFNVQLEDGQKLCGDGDGDRCPNEGDLALQGCDESTPGYDASTGNCALPMAAWCRQESGKCVPQWA